MSDLQSAERQYYGLAHPESQTEFAPSESDSPYMIGFTWETFEDSVTRVNWFVMQTFDWHTPTESGRVLMRRGCSGSPPPKEQQLPVDQWREAEFIATGFIKWDGCAQWECDVHLDGKDERKTFFDVVHLAHLRAAQIMGECFDGPLGEA